MRRAARLDQNHTDVVEALEQIGCLVLSLASMGKGVPDLLVCTPRGVLLLFEVKDGSKPPSARRLKPDQVEWHDAWKRAPLHVVLSPAQACEIALAA